MIKRCKYCDKEFTPNKHAHHQKYCSNKCRNKDPEVKQHRKEYLNKYDQQPWRKQYKKEQNKKYRNRPEVKQARKKYAQSQKVKQQAEEYRSRPDVKKRIKDYSKKYYNNPEAKQHRRNYSRNHWQGYYSRPEIKQHKQEYSSNYGHTERGREVRRLNNAKKRMRTKNIVLMPNVFPDEIQTNHHHLLNKFYNPDSELWFVWVLPQLTHLYKPGNMNSKEHWRHNALWIKKLYDIDIKEFLEGKYK